MPSVEHRPGQRTVLKGDLPSPMSPPPGCRFHTRFVAATSVCREERPTLTLAAQGHLVACHHPRPAWRHADRIASA